MRIVLALVLVLSIAGSAHAQRPVDAEIAQVREQVLYASYPDAIAAGQALLARTDLDATERDAQQDAITGTTTPGRSIAEEPAFWIVIGLVVVGAAVGTGVGIALSSEGGPEQGTLGSVVLRH